MAQPADLVRLVTVFDLRDDTPAPVETAEFGIVGQFTAPPTTGAAWDTALLTLAQGAADLWSTGISPAFFSHGDSLKQCRAIRMSAAGATLNEQVAAPAAPWVGDATQHSLPWSSSLVVSLYTYTPGSFIAHAGRRRGRVYPPPLNISVLNTVNQGTISPANALTMLNDFHDWLFAVAGLPALATLGIEWQPGVLSLAAGNFNRLTDLAIDTKIDTQRRREKTQKATRQSVAF
jgi:hypothetical protein